MVLGHLEKNPHKSEGHRKMKGMGTCDFMVDNGVGEPRLANQMAQQGARPRYSGPPVGTRWPNAAGNKSCSRGRPVATGS